MENRPDKARQETREQLSTIDIGYVLQKLKKCNLRLMEIHMENPFARVVEEGFSEPESETPPSGMVFLAKPEHGGEEDSAGRRLLAEKEKMFAALHQEFDDELKKIGLSLVESTKLYIYGNLNISLSDPYNFLEYVERLGEGSPKLSHVEGVKELMTQFYNTLMYGSGGAGELDEEGVDELDAEQNHLVVDFFAIREKFKDACKKLDPDSSRGLVEVEQNFSTLLDAAKKRYLREYLIAERYNLLSAPGERYSLADFHKGILDGSFLYGDPGDQGSDEEKTRSALANYERIWNDTLNYVRAIKKNKNAKELFVAVMKNLQSVLEYVEDSIQEEGFEFSKEKRKSALLETIRKTKLALQELDRTE